VIQVTLGTVRQACDNIAALFYAISIGKAREV
jgi:hypothetical protein